jgi:3-deoxy-7-phosphoheptulonate synthase
MKSDSIFNSNLVAAQQPIWPDAAAVKDAVAESKSFPPLVFAGECDNLKARIAEAAVGNAFGCKVAIAPKPLLQQPLIQFVIE